MFSFVNNNIFKNKSERYCKGSIQMSLDNSIPTSYFQLFIKF